jgi:hypothetical protein
MDMTSVLAHVLEGRAMVLVLILVIEGHVLVFVLVLADSVLDCC